MYNTKRKTSTQCTIESWELNIHPCSITEKMKCLYNTLYFLPYYKQHCTRGTDPAIQQIMQSMQSNQSIQRLWIIFIANVYRKPSLMLPQNDNSSCLIEEMGHKGGHR